MFEKMSGHLTDQLTGKIKHHTVVYITSVWCLSYSMIILTKVETNFVGKLIQFIIYFKKVLFDLQKSVK